MARSTNANLGITILGDYKGGPAFGKAATDANRLNKSVTGLTASVRDYVVGFGAVAGASFAFNEAEEAEVTLRATEEVIRSTGNAAQVSAKQQDEMVDSLSELAGLDDEIVAGGANMLRTFTDIQGVDIFEGALSSSLDLAAKFGSVDAAAVKVGKALNDPIAGLTSLSKAGIQFDDSQKKMIRSLVEGGNKAEAQRIILKELETQFGGQAEAAATASGRIKVSIGNTAESIGTVLLPALDAAATGVGFLADAFTSLPGPAQQATLGALGLAYAVPKVISGFQAAGNAADFFKLGLAGVTEKGAGFSNALGGMIFQAGGLSTVLPVAAAGVGILGLALIEAAGDSERLSANIESLRQQLEQGVDPENIFKDQLQATLSGAEGGFELDISGDTFRRALDELGVGAKELNALLTGSEENWDAFIESVLASGLGPVIIPQLETLRKAGTEAVDVQKQQDAIGKELGNTTDKTAAATEGLTARTKDLRSASEKLNDTFTEALSDQEAITSAREGYTDASADAARAAYELGVAQRAAAGDSEEYRDAEQNIADAVAEIPEAQRRAQDAVEDLNEARVDAAENLRDLARAEREAALASADAALRVKEAENEQRRINADPRSTALEKERAALEVAQAREEARGAKEDAAQAQIDNAEAQRKGIEGDAAVVAAREAVAEADRGVADARRKVGDAERAAAAIIAKAKADVLVAQQNSTEAAIDEAEAWGELVTQHFGAVAGAKAYRDKLAEISADIAPGSPLALRLARLIEDINTAIARGTTRGSSTALAEGLAGVAPGPTSTGGITGGDRLPQSSDSRAPGASGNVITLNQTNIIQGTSTQVRRAQDQQTHRTLDHLARRLR